MASAWAMETGLGPLTKEDRELNKKARAMLEGRIDAEPGRYIPKKEAEQLELDLREEPILVFGKKYGDKIEVYGFVSELGIGEEVR